MEEQVLQERLDNLHRAYQQHQIAKDLLREAERELESQLGIFSKRLLLRSPLSQTPYLFYMQSNEGYRLHWHPTSEKLLAGAEEHTIVTLIIAVEAAKQELTSVLKTLELGYHYHKATHSVVEIKQTQRGYDIHHEFSFESLGSLKELA